MICFSGSGTRWLGHCLSVVFREYSMKETKYEQNRFRKQEEQKTELPSVAELGK